MFNVSFQHIVKGNGKQSIMNNITTKQAGYRMLGCSRLGVDIMLLKQNTIDEKSISYYFEYIEEFVGSFISDGFVEVAIDVK